MRNRPFILIALYIFFFCIVSIYGIGEKTILLGSGFTWDLMEKRQGVTEAHLIRPHPVLVLDSTASFTGDQSPVSQDCYLSFDEGSPLGFRDSIGRYDVSAPDPASFGPGAVSAPWSRNGKGAALFSSKTGPGASAGKLTLKPGKNALFASGSQVRSFSIEFWLNPQNLETGEQIFSLTASKPDGMGGYVYQDIQCTVSRNRLHWNLGNLFFAPGEKDPKSLTLSGPYIINKTWSRHLIRFDADLGLLEYLVDNKLEALEYATSTGRESGEVYTPFIGENCRLELGSRFSGMMDEFRIYRGCLADPGQGIEPKFGRVETRTLDLGNTNSRLLKIEAFGGRTGFRNEYAGNGTLRFQDHSEIRIYARVSNSPYIWTNSPWIPVDTGTDLGESFIGRYVQVASEFYPGWDGEVSPYLSELRLIYNAAEPPAPPTNLIAVAKNGAVELSWKASPSRDVGGYMVYYGNAKGEYFGNHAIMDSELCLSPIDVSNRTSIVLEGLNSGLLYYFVVTAYDKPVSPGEFSREVAARPLPALRF